MLVSLTDAYTVFCLQVQTIQYINDPEVQNKLTFRILVHYID